MKITEILTSKFCCWKADVTAPNLCIVEAGNAREAAIKAAPMLIKDINEYHEDSVFITVVSNKNEIENQRVSIQKKLTLDEE